MNLSLAQIVELTGQYGQGWAVPHARRVLGLARQIAGELRPDWRALEYAAYLHDWGAFPRYLQPGVNHALRSRQVAESEILPQAGLPVERNRRILEAIELHDYRDERPADSPETRLLREADFLDFLGAIGVARECAWGPNHLRACIDRAARRKDLLAERFSLPAAQEIAAVRLARMDQVLAWLEEESMGEL
jgi:uncharacterized protein